MLNVIYAKGRKQAHYAECLYAECRSAECCGADTRATQYCTPWYEHQLTYFTF